MPASDRKRTGAWYSPMPLVEHVVARTVGVVRPGQRVSVLDPACGDGRFLVAAGAAIRRSGGVPALTGVDIDLGGLRAAGRMGATAAAGIDAIDAIEADALSHDWGDHRFDVIVGNPPFLAQRASATARAGRSKFGGGPYADAAADFLALGVRLAGREGRLGLVLPTSLLTARDAGPIRRAAADEMELVWFWSAQEALFDATVRTCAVGLRRSGGRGTARAGSPLPVRRDTSPVERTHGPAFASIAAATAPDATANDHWGWLIADSHGLPVMPVVRSHSSLADRATATANFRDQYYGLVGAVGDGYDGPPLITTGLIDAGRCWWGERATRFAKQRFEAPRVDRSRLAPVMQRWAERCLVPKVLVATQTRVLEAVVDPDGAWLPAVPVIRIVPHERADLWRVGALLTSPVASALVAHQSVGSGLSTTTMRVSQRTLGALPWPSGSLEAAVDALRSGDLAGCGRAVDAAFGIDQTEVADALFSWWWDGVCGRRPQRFQGATGDTAPSPPVSTS